MSLDDDKFQKLGEVLQKHNWDNKSFAVASDIREYLKNIVDHDTPINGYVDLIQGGICLKPVINDHEFLVVVYKLVDKKEEEYG